MILVYSQFELIQIKLKKKNRLQFSVVLGNLQNLMLWTFFENRCPPWWPTPTQLPPRRHNGLRTSIPGLEGALVLTQKEKP
jgi:hypothetical protein